MRFIRILTPLSKAHHPCWYLLNGRKLNSVLAHSHLGVNSDVGSENALHLVVMYSDPISYTCFVTKLHYQFSVHCCSNACINSQMCFCSAPCSVEEVLTISQAVKFSVGPAVATSGCMSLAGLCLLLGASQLANERSTGTRIGKHALLLLQVPGLTTFVLRRALKA